MREREGNFMKTPFRIERKDSFRVIGYAIHTTNKKGEGKKAIPLHWDTFKQKQLDSLLLSFGNQQYQGLFGINVYNTDRDDSRKFTYYIAVSSDVKEEDGREEYVVPAATWAVFPCTLDTIGKTEVAAISKWLPKSGYKALNKGYITGRMKSQAPDIEYYGADGQIEVWIAVDETRK